MPQILDLTKTYSKTDIKKAKEEVAQYDEPAAGGYICKIVYAELKEDKQYVLLNLDIADGKYAGYYQRLDDRAGFWGLKYYASYKETVLSKFIKLCASFETCNPGFAFDPFRKGGADIDTLKGKTLGVVIGYEEYEKNDGSIGTRARVSNITEVKKIKAGKFKIPELKKVVRTIPTTENESFMTLPDNMDEIPFGV